MSQYVWDQCEKVSGGRIIQVFYVGKSSKAIRDSSRPVLCSIGERVESGIAMVLDETFTV